MRALNTLFPNTWSWRLFVSLFFLTASLALAQHGIGTNEPNPEAALEISSPDKGVLLPKIELVSSTLFLGGITATTSHTGMLVYNTNTATNTGLIGEGYYHWNGTQWEKFTGQGDLFWDLDRDTGVQVEEGTDDDTIRFDTTGAERMVIDNTGNVGIGTATPDQKLDVVGNAEMGTAGEELYIGDIGLVNQAGIAHKSQAASNTYALTQSNLGATTINSAPSQAIIFRSNNLQNARLTSDGKFSVGAALNSNPRMSVQDKDHATDIDNITAADNDTNNYAYMSTLSLANSNNALYLGVSGTFNDRKSYLQSGHFNRNFTSGRTGVLSLNPVGGAVGIGTVAPTKTLDVNGQARIRNLPVGVATDEIITANSNGDLRKLPLSQVGTDSQTLAIGTTTATETLLTLENSQDLTLTASGSLSFNRTSSSTLELIGDASQLIDADGDTQIQVEEGADDDTIRFDTDGTERAVINAAGDLIVFGNQTVSQPTQTVSLNPTAAFTTIADVSTWEAANTALKSLSLNIATPDSFNFADPNITGAGITVSNPTTVIGNLATSYWYYRQVNTTTRRWVKIEFQLSGNNLQARFTDAKFIFNAAALTPAQQTDAYFSNNGSASGIEIDDVTLNYNEVISDFGESLVVKNNNGRVGVNTATPTHTLTVSGTAQVTGAIHDSSGDAGTAGQVLSSTVTGTNWVNFSGGGVNAKKVYSAEYAGAIFSADATDNLGTMTAENAGASNNYMNYYQWSSTQSTTQDYDVVLRFTLPNDFQSWQTNAIQVDYVVSNAASATLSTSIYLETGGAALATASGTATTWAKVSIASATDLASLTTPGMTAVIILKLAASDDATVRIGDVTLNYVK